MRFAQKNIDGNLLVFDINSNTPQPTVLSAADCCQACKNHDGCTSWTYCPRPEGCANDCPIYIAKSAPALPASLQYVCGKERRITSNTSP